MRQKANLALVNRQPEADNTSEGLASLLAANTELRSELLGDAR
jgi:hypothetical protein